MPTCGGGKSYSTDCVVRPVVGYGRKRAMTLFLIVLAIALVVIALIAWIFYEMAIAPIVEDEEE